MFVYIAKLIPGKTINKKCTFSFFESKNSPDTASLASPMQTNPLFIKKV